MIDYETAKRLAVEFVSRIFPRDDDEVVILDERTIVKDYGWVIFCNSRLYMEHGRIQDVYLGLGPLIVEKRSGTVYPLGTARTLEEAIKWYES